MLPAYRRIKTSDRNLDQLQQNLSASLAPLLSAEIVDGILMDAVFTGAGAKSFNHLLGRQPTGWIVTDRNGVATLYRSAWTEQSITLVASAAVTTKIWLF